MEMVKVKSSNLDSIGYNESDRKLRVLFKGGRLYEYSNVPIDIFIALQKAESLGKFFQANVRTSFKFERIES